MSHEKDMNVSSLLDFYSPLLSDAERESADLYFNQDLSLAEIAELHGISRNGERLRLEKVRRDLLRYESALGLKKQYDKENSLFDRLEEKAKTLPENERKEILDIIEALRNGGETPDV